MNHVTYLNNIYIDNYINCHVVSYKRKLQISLESNFILRMLKDTN